MPALARASLLRPVLVVVVGALFMLGTYTGAPAPLNATPPAAAAVAPQPTAIARVGAAVITGQGLVDALHFDFTSPMNAATVQAALTIEPATQLQLAWSSGGRVLQVRPAPAWQAATAYAVTIGPAARDMQGVPLASAVQATFTTRKTAAARLALVSAGASASAKPVAVAVTFTRPVLVASVASAVKVSPSVAGRLTPAGGTSRGLATRFTWRPREVLRPGTTYALSLKGSVLDEDGLPVPAAGRIALRTPSRPAIVRHRPASGATGVARDALLSVRFTERMERSSTQRAFAVSGLAAARDGTFSWYERDTVLAYDPRSSLVAGRRYTVTIAGSARSAAGVPLKAAAGSALSFSFRVQGTTAATLTSSTKRPSSGGSTGTSWLAVERYVLGLVNCIRTGGTLQSDGDCVGYGSGRNGGYAAPLTIHHGISDKVARPYAKFLAVRAACNHFLDGNPGFRLRRSGYTSYRWAENLGCRSGNPYSAVLGSHLYFQSEKSYSGGHWVNLKNRQYTTVGIGVWVSNGNVRVVTDFYDP
jgi:Big-like domain-containing protein